MAPTPKLTSTQQRYLDEIKAGRRKYTGTARKPIEALERAGLLHARYITPYVTGRGKWEIVITSVV